MLFNVKEIENEMTCLLTFQGESSPDVRGEVKRLSSVESAAASSNQLNELDSD